jgi:dienelactone hydrolase
MRYALAAIASVAIGAALAQDSTPAPLALEPGEHAVGFRLLEEQDPARTVTGGSGAAPQPRPLRIYLWYPAAETPQRVTFGRYAAFADDDVWPAEITGPLHDRLQYSRRSIARSLSAEEYRALLARPMLAGENAEPLREPFPLIAIGQGLYYESPAAFAAFAEYLAGRGFVVTTTPLVGTNSPLVKLDVQDLQNQVRDLELAIAHARELPFVSRDSLGVVGFDNGGMVGLILTMRNRDVDAFASLDSGIVFAHPSGLPRSAPDHDPLALRVPWLHAMTPRGEPDSARSLFDEAIHSDRFLLRVESMNHVDYTSYALVEGRDAMPLVEPPAAASLNNHRLVANYVWRFLAATLTGDADSRRFLTERPELEPRMTLEHRGPTAPSITYEALVAAVVDGRADEAVRELRALAAIDPDHGLLQQTTLERLGMSLVFTWDLAAESLPLLRLAEELHPASTTVQGVLAEAYLRLEEQPPQ